MALHFVKSHVAYLEGTPMAKDLDGLIKKVEAGLPDKVANHIGRIGQVYLSRFGPIRDYATQGDVLAQLQRALLLQRRVVLRHTKPGYEEPVDHLIDPYALLLHQFGLYVVGHSHRAEALCVYAVERIESVQLVDERFELPKDLRLDRVYETQFGLMDEPPQQIRVWFSASVAYLVRERRWHPTQHVTRQPDGSVVVTFQAGGIEELASWVLSWGGEARVLEPPALVETVTSGLRRALHHYK